MLIPNGVQKRVEVILTGNIPGVVVVFTAVRCSQHARGRSRGEFGVQNILRSAGGELANVAGKTNSFHLTFSVF